ncbi:MAG: tannase/feruloyl esterase family alpha/beta hydrolase, partial [Caldilineaceae bacterium]|nr:tannase/feruloyl esterase family alpha/beta hydrolase [Caldilineaceae bacterium]
MTACSSLAERTVHEYTILSATDLEAAGDVPRRCRVLGVLPPEIVFEVVLPAEWNGRIVMRGNGGYAGNSPDNPGSIRASERIAADGFVSVYTNTGHDRTAEPLGTFAFNNRQKEIDYSFRAVRLTIQTAKELVGLYYGRPPNYTYWRGCST